MTWDESKHPRVPKGSAEGGQFTDKVAGAAREAAGLTPRERRIDQYKRFWGVTGPNKEYEMAFQITDRGADMGWRGEPSGKGQVHFSDDEVDRMALAALIHNHPVPAAHSPADVEFFFGNGLSELAVAEKYGLHVLRWDGGVPNRQEWWGVGQYAKQTLYQLWDQVFSEHLMGQLEGVVGPISDPAVKHGLTVEAMMRLDDSAEVGEWMTYEYIPWEDLQ